LKRAIVLETLDVDMPIRRPDSANDPASLRGARGEMKSYRRSIIVEVEVEGPGSERREQSVDHVRETRERLRSSTPQASSAPAACSPSPVTVVISAGIRIG
jgi:hypothetical protein